MLRALLISCLLCIAVRVFSNDASSSQNRIINYAQGHASFKELYFKEHEAEFSRLAREGQLPRTLFIGCSDSRVIPELISTSRPGDLFVIRTAGNFVPVFNPEIPWDGVAATIWYAVEVLNVKDIIVCGHSQCGAIAGLFKPKPPGAGGEMLSRWLQFGLPAKNLVESLLPGSTPENQVRTAAHFSIVFQLENLLGYTFVKEKVASDQLFLHGWYFDIESGSIEYLEPKTMEFRPLNAAVLQK